MQPYDTIRFSGAKKTYEALDASAVVDMGLIGPSGESIVDITAGAHGFLAGPTAQLFNCVYLLGPTYYAGLKRIFSVPDANSMYIFSSYTAETMATGDTFRTAYTSKFPFEFLGFEIHLDAASATSENLVVARDSVLGSTFDTKIYSINMNAEQNVIYMIPKDEPVLCDANDVIDLTWDNSNSKTWTVKFFVRSRV